MLASALSGAESGLAERLEVHAMADIGRRLYQAHFDRPDLATPDRVRELLRQAADDVEDLRFSLSFLWTKWSRVVDAWQLASWEQYRDVPRLGTRTRLPERQRELLLSIFFNVAPAVDGRAPRRHVYRWPPLTAFPPNTVPPRRALRPPICGRSASRRM